jgi:hypothetical protein
LCPSLSRYSSHSMTAQRRKLAAVALLHSLKRVPGTFSRLHQRGLLPRSSALSMSSTSGQEQQKTSSNDDQSTCAHGPTRKRAILCGMALRGCCSLCLAYGSGPVQLATSLLSLASCLRDFPAQFNISLLQNACDDVMLWQRTQHT